MEEEACHLKIVDGEGSFGELLNHRGGPANSPHRWMEVVFATEPDAASAVLACVTEAHKVGPARHQLLTFGGAVGDHFHEHQQVLQGVVGIRVAPDVDWLPLGPGRVISWQELVKWAKQAFPIGNAKAGMLKFSNEGLKLSSGQLLPVQSPPDGGSNRGALGWGQLHGSVDAIKDPPQDFLSESPNAFPFSHFLQGNGFIIWVSNWVRGWWEDGVDAMEESPGVVEEDCRVGALQGPEIIVHKDLQQVLQLGSLFW